MVNPGGTGSPTRLISASPAPLPPRRSLMDALPSSNSQMRLGAALRRDPRPAPPRETFLVRRRTAMVSPTYPVRRWSSALHGVFRSGLGLSFHDHPREIGDGANEADDACQQRQPGGAHRLVLGHHEDVGEEPVDGIGEAAQLQESLLVAPGGEGGPHAAAHLLHRLGGPPPAGGTRRTPWGGCARPGRRPCTRGRTRAGAGTPTAPGPARRRRPRRPPARPRRRASW